MERKNTGQTIKVYATNWLKNKVWRYDNPVQRGFVWDTSRMSDLVDSIVRDFPIPPIYGVIAEDEEGNKYKDIFDGQQRSVTLQKLYNDEFAMTGIAPFKLDGIEYDINGLRYSDFPQPVKDVIDGYYLTFYYFEDMTPHEKSELYRKLNNGRPLSNKDMNIANCLDLYTATDLGRNKFFSLVLTQSGLQQKKQIALVMKIWAMLNLDIHEISFDSKSFNTLLRHTMISDQERTEIETVMNYMSSILEIAFKNKGLTPEMKNAGIKLKKEIHYISLVPIAKKALDNEIPVEKFYEFCLVFFGKSEDEMDIAYKAACTAQTARNSSILARHEVLEEEFNNFLEFCKDTAE